MNNLENNYITMAADIIIEFDDKSIVLIKRGDAPFQGQWAIPGGGLEGDETIQETAIREAKEETGLDVELIRIIGVYSKVGRDPRGRNISVAFLAKPIGGELRASSDAEDFLKTTNYAKLQLAFDHNQIIADYLKSIKE